MEKNISLIGFLADYEDEKKARSAFDLCWPLTEHKELN